MLTVGRRPSSTAAGTPATVTTPVNRSTGPPTCQTEWVSSESQNYTTLGNTSYSSGSRCLSLFVSSVLFRALDWYMTDIVCCFCCWLAEWRFSESHERESDQHLTATTTAASSTTTKTTTTTTQNPELPARTYDKRTVPVERGS